MIIPEKTIKEAAVLYTNIHLVLLVPEAEITNTAKDLYDFSISDFESGVQFAESYIVEHTKGFAEFIINDMIKFNGIPKTPTMYLFEFLKGRNDEK